MRTVVRIAFDRINNNVNCQRSNVRSALAPTIDKRAIMGNCPPPCSQKSDFKVDQNTFLYGRPNIKPWGTNL